MSKDNFKKSIFVFTISLITPLLVWFVLYLLAQNSQNSFDPSPWVQDFVKNPRPIQQKSPELSWIYVMAKDGDLYVDHHHQLTPLEQYTPASEKLIFLVEAQGPTLAFKLFQFLKDKNLESRSLILSASDGFLKDLRFHNAQLTLGAGQAYLVRFRALQQIALQGFMVINMSGVWLQPEIFKSSTQKLTDTFNQLHVPIFIGPVSEQEMLLLPKNANYLITE